MTLAAGLGDTNYHLGVCVGEGLPVPVPPVPGGENVPVSAGGAIDVDVVPPVPVSTPPASTGAADVAADASAGGAEKGSLPEKFTTWLGDSVGEGATVGSSPGDYAAFLKAEQKKWAKLIKEVNLKLE